MYTHSDTHINIYIYGTGEACFAYIYSRNLIVFM